VRHGVGYAIDGNTQIQPGDCVVVFSLSTIIKKLDRYFGRPTSSISRFISSLSHS
jgi:Trk K+ transport system NAD-binding subunit